MAYGILYVVDGRGISYMVHGRWYIADGTWQMAHGMRDRAPTREKTNISYVVHYTCNLHLGRFRHLRHVLCIHECALRPRPGVAMARCAPPVRAHLAPAAGFRAAAVRRPQHLVLRRPPLRSAWGVCPGAAVAAPESVRKPISGVWRTVGLALPRGAGASALRGRLGGAGLVPSLARAQVAAP